MEFENALTRLLGVRYPIVQAGMVWASGWRLASAVSKAGGLGVIGAGSMTSELLREHIQKCREATNAPFAVNLPLLYPAIEKHIEVIMAEKAPIVFTSAGNPATWTPALKRSGITVIHVVSSSKFAAKAEAAGCDAVVAEGFEAGGHNGREETTTMVLVPAVCSAVNIPVIAAGGIATGRQMLAAMTLGAAGVQMGTRFVASEEASSHASFKQLLVNSKEGDTSLQMRTVVPVRLLKNAFANRIIAAELRGATPEDLRELLGRGRARLGMFEGNLEEGELEIGQVSANIMDIMPAATIVEQTWREFEELVSDPLKMR